MFTGLIEEIGRLGAIIKTGAGGSVRISASKVLEGVKLGDSIAVDGVCLTVSKYDNHGFNADIMPATLTQTRISGLRVGSEVHLERALRIGDRLGGHFVSGHVDGQSKVISLKNEGDAYRLRFERSKSFWAHVVHKGSITINGVSLTIDGIGSDWLEVSLVKHTQGETVLAKLKEGDILNIESDMLLKYAHSLIVQSGSKMDDSSQSSTENDNNITMSQLQQAGFLY